LLVLPLLAAGATYAVRRLSLLAALIAIVTSGSLALLCLRLPLDRSAFVLGQEVAFGRPVVLLGRTLMLEPAGQAWLAYVFVLATVFYFFAWSLSQGRSFFPFSLVILALYSLVALSRSFPMAVIVFGISAMLAIFIIQGGQPRSVRGAQRFLVVTLLAVPALLAATWMLDQAAIDPAGVALARQALLPAALGFGLLLAIIPFGTWMPAMAADAPPIISAFIFTISQGMVIFLVVTFRPNDPLALATPAIANTIQLSGLLMVVAGGLIAAVQRDFGRLLGYAALSDLGYVLLAWASGGTQSVDLALLHMVNRAAPIALMASALAVLRHRATTDSFAALHGVARRLPIPTAGLLIGALALAGFPFTAGFPTHWAVSRTVLNGQWAWGELLLPASTVVVLLLLSSAGVMMGLLRGLGSMLGDRPRPDVASQPVAASAIVLLLAALVIVIGLYPQLFLAQVQAMF
jgi:multicomponent Na+:H+ antiporter subunit A